jgi:hypothetical protein
VSAPCCPDEKIACPWLNTTTCRRSGQERLNTADRACSKPSRLARPAQARRSLTIRFPRRFPSCLGSLSGRIFADVDVPTVYSMDPFDETIRSCDSPCHWDTCPVDRTRAAVLVPGRRYSVQAPLLAYIGEALERRSVVVERMTWSPPDDATPLWVAQQVGAVLGRMRGRPLVVGKSLGTLAAPLTVAVGRPLPGIWLTPLLREPFVVAALRRTTEPALVVGGTADHLAGWDSGLVRSLGPAVHEVPGGDHSLLVPGPLSDSALVLGEVVSAVESFLDEFVWPGG